MRSLPVGFSLALAALFSVVILGVFNTRSDLQTLQTTSQENIFWSAAQVEREYGALQVELARLAVDPAVDANTVRKRFDILWSRVAIFGQGEIGERLLADPEVRETHTKLSALLEKLDPLIVSLQDGPSASRDEISLSLRQFESVVRSSTIRVLHSDENRFAEIRNAMREGMMLTAAALLLTILVALALAILATRDARKSAILAKAATAAAASRKQFFSMMSHELRTPLNGMLGSLALMKDEPDRETQRILIDEAHASAHRLSNLVTDALDLNADDALEMDPSLFKVTDIVEAIRNSIEPELRRRDAVFTVSGIPETVDFLKCDFRRLTHALSHLTINALQRGNAQEIRLYIAVADEKLSIEIGTDVTLPHDAFGETLARGIIERLGGTIESHESMRAIEVPVKVVHLAAQLVFSSNALSRMYEALLKASGIATFDGGSKPADIVLVEAGQDPKSCSALRRENQDAVIIACGTPTSPHAFDEISRTPDDLMRAVHAALGRVRSRQEIAA